MKLGGTAEVYDTPVLSIELIGRDFFYDRLTDDLKSMAYHEQKFPSRKLNLSGCGRNAFMMFCRSLTRFRKERK